MLLHIERSRSDEVGDVEDGIASGAGSPRTLLFALLLHQQRERFPVGEIAFPSELLELV